MLAPSLVVMLALSQPGQIKLAAPGFKAVNISEADANFYSEHFAQQLKLFGLSVSTASDISALLGLERQKQLMGCADDATSCVAEIAGALGADGLVKGTLGKFGPLYQINLNILKQDGSSLVVFSSRVKGEEPLLDEFTLAARQMSLELHQKLGRPIPDSLIEKPSTLRSYSWIPAVSGLVAGGAGAFLFVQSRNRLGALQEVRTDEVGADPAAYAAAGRTEQTAGVALLAVGGAALTGAAIMYLLGKPPPVTGAVGVTASGAQAFIEVPLP